MLITLLACTSPVEDSAPAEVLVYEHRFSFVVLADPHISSNVEHQERLAGAVAWVNENAVQERIELVWVVGDIGWGTGLPISRELLDALEVPYLPVIGDNEVHFGDEVPFDQTFGPVLDAHVGLWPDFHRGQVEVYDAVAGREMALQNFSFSYGGLRWVGLDWCSRDPSNLYSEFAELHDHQGGSLPFFRDEISLLEPADTEDVLLFSHHPMHIGSFDLAEMEELTELVGPVSGRVAAAFAGHIHQDATVEVPDAGYTAFVTDATWDDEDTVRLVRVLSSVAEDGTERFQLEQELLVVDWAQ